MQQEKSLKSRGLIRGGVIKKCVRLEKIHKDLTLKSDLLEGINLVGCGPVGEGVRKFNHLFWASIMDEPVAY